LEPSSDRSHSSYSRNLDRTRIDTTTGNLDRTADPLLKNQGQDRHPAIPVFIGVENR
jgi:hypothetical protein